MLQLVRNTATCTAICLTRIETANLQHQSLHEECNQCCCDALWLIRAHLRQFHFMKVHMWPNYSSSKRGKEGQFDLEFALTRPPKWIADWGNREKQKIETHSWTTTEHRGSNQVPTYYNVNGLARPIWEIYKMNVNQKSPLIIACLQQLIACTHCAKNWHHWN